MPEQPVVAVLATGDPLLVGPLEAVLEQRLRQGQLDVRDEHNSFQLESLLENSNGRVDIAELGPILAAEGFHVVVLVRYELGAERELPVPGRIHLKVARLRLNAYLLANGSSLGRGWTEGVEYTDLSADAKARQAFVGASGELVRAIRERWTTFREQGR